MLIQLLSANLATRKDPLTKQTRWRVVFLVRSLSTGEESQHELELDSVGRIEPTSGDNEITFSVTGRLSSSHRRPEISHDKQSSNQ